MLDLDISGGELTTVLMEKLESIAAILDSSDAEVLLKEDLVLDGINVFIFKVLTLKIKKTAEDVVGNPSIQEPITDYIKTNPEVSLLHSFFALVTNYCSHSKSGISFMEYKDMVDRMKPFWFDSKFKVLHSVTLPSLQNLTTDEEKRTILIETHSSLLASCIDSLKNAKDWNSELVLKMTTFLGNLTNSREARKYLLKVLEVWNWEDLFKLLDPSYSTDVRKAVSMIVKHMTADVVSHSYLLEEKVNILPTLLLPLAGGEAFSDEEYAEMPPELQYLGENKTRDEDAEVRENLLMALLQLCRLKKCRIKIRDSNTYYILRELHKFETQEEMIELVEKVVDLLIRTEDEIGEKGDFVNFDVPELEEWLNGDWIPPEESGST